MKHKTWFRLVIKVIGLVIVIFALPQVLSVSIGLLLWWTGISFSSGAGPEMWLWNWPYYVGAAAQAAIGLYLLFGGKWLVNLCIPSNRPYCPECGYDLSKARGDRCPECGVKLPAGLLPIAQREAAHVPPGA